MEQRSAYEKPGMRFVNLVSNKTVADSCWSLDGTTKPNGNPGTANYSGPFYYNYDGAGFMSFWLKSTDGSCGAPDAFNIQYYNGGSAADFDEDQLEELLTQKGGNNGQPYDGLLSDFPYTPSNMS